ncbi:hypothetical protein B0H14DRAFT_2557987 [Mycena olivaceomarginata]|nr:hypothetical protein B0H14DRAFT_2557987 [Mycena olivaceomarginata]
MESPHGLHTEGELNLDLDQTQAKIYFGICLRSLSLLICPYSQLGISQHVKGFISHSHEADSSGAEVYSMIASLRRWAPVLDERHSGGDWHNPPVRIFKASHAHLPQKDPRNSRPTNQLVKGVNQPMKGAIPTQSKPHPDPVSI